MKRSQMSLFPAGSRTMRLVGTLFCVQALPLFLQVLCLADASHGLMCWHCIAENCDLSPDDNPSAQQRTCYEGQTCQKVVFEMQSDIDDTKYKSTVRSCADECIPQNDFENCTEALYKSSGCVKRVCCRNDDLCNTSGPSPLRMGGWQQLLILFVSFIVGLRTLLSWVR